MRNDDVLKSISYTLDLNKPQIAEICKLGGYEPDRSEVEMIFSSIAASIAVALVVGFLAGSVLVDPETLSPPMGEEVKTVEADEPSPEPRREEALPQPGRSAPVPESQASSGEAFRPAFSTSSAPRADTVGIPSALTTLGDW